MCVKLSPSPAVLITPSTRTRASAAATKCVPAHTRSTAPSVRASVTSLTASASSGGGGSSPPPAGQLGGGDEDSRNAVLKKCILALAIEVTTDI